MVFGYVFDPAKADIGELPACKDTSYSFPCLGKLYNIAKILTVGNMVVEVRSRGLLINNLSLRPESASPPARIGIMKPSRLANNGK